MEQARTTKVIVELPQDVNEKIAAELMKKNRENNKFSGGYLTKSAFVSQLLIDYIREKYGG